jgi:hypothetical protein
MKRLLFLVIATLAITNITGQDATIYKLPDGISPVIDGYVDNLWHIYEEFNIDKPFQTEKPTLDKATWRAVWNDTALFIVVSVEEDDFCPHWCEPASADWNSDRPDIYLDVNENLKDGEGPVFYPNGHYQFAPGFTEGENQHYFRGQTWHGWEYSYAYKVDGSDYVFEYALMWSSITDENGIVYDPEGGRLIGFDVYVTDRDEGENWRRRAVWMNDGNGPGMDEAWNNMDDCGILAFKGFQITDTVACDTGSTAHTFFIVPVDSITDYEWDADGGEILSSNESSAVIKWNTTGEKNISLVITKIGGAKDTFETRVTVYPGLSVSLGEDFTICPNTEFTITPSAMNGIRPFDYFWNSQPGDSVFVGSFVDTSYVNLTIEDNVGCTATDNIFITVPQTVFTEQICLVTVDAVTGKNKIVWQKTGGRMIKNYLVQVDSAATGQYSVIGTVPFNDESVFIDMTSEPSEHSDKYRMVTVDSCGNISNQSSIHRTIHLSLSPGLPGEYNLSWSSYAGFDYSTYYIYKGSSPENMELIDSIAKTKTQYTDNESGVAYYQVAVRRDEPCDISVLKSSENIYSEAASNIENTITSNIDNNKIQETSFILLPNPFVDELVIEYKLSEPSGVSFEIYNLLGMKVYEFNTEHELSGIYRHVIDKESLRNAGNLIIVRLELGGKVYFRKLLRK